MFTQPILIYSMHCSFSEKFIQILSQFKDIFSTFAKINIDPVNGIRNPAFYEIQKALNIKITEVPTIIINNNDQNYVLSGEEAFKWLDYQIKSQQITQIPIKQEKELSGFNPNEMGAFSDQYSNFGSNDLHDAKDQSFVFIDKKYESITTLPEDLSKNTPKTTPQYTQYIQQAPQKSQEIFYGNKESFSNTQTSKNDTDKRFEELMSQRQQMDKPTNGGPKNIDFSTGKIIM